MANTPTVYVICNNNCKYEGMTKEQILTAIMQAVNEGTIGNIDTGFITTLKTINGLPLRFFVGTQAEYNALANKSDLFAIITDDTNKDNITKIIEELRKTLSDLVVNLSKGLFVVAKSSIATKAERDDKGNIIDKTYGNFAQSWVGTSLLGDTLALNGEGTYLFTVYVRDAYAEFRASAIAYFDGNNETVSMLNCVPLSDNGSAVYRLNITKNGVASVQRSRNNNGYTNVTHSISDGYSLTMGYKKIL